MVKSHSASPWKLFLIALACGFSFACASVDVAPKEKPEKAATETSQAQPLTGKTMGQICTNDALLLTRFDATKLHGTPLPAPCCKKGVLPESESHRCNLDWPSSDVPSCKIWESMRSALAKLHPVETTRTPLVVKNLKQLESWSKTRFSCQ